MKRCALALKYLIIALIAVSLLTATANGEVDLFARNKSDSTIKMLVFPLSMAVVENRPLKGLYYFYEGEVGKFNDESLVETKSAENPLHEILSDKAMIQKTLVKTDPTRVAPSKQHDDIIGPVTRQELKALSAKYKKDMLLVFRREIYLHPDKMMPDTFFQHPENLINLKEPITLKIKNSAILYLAKQNKILMIPPNEQSKTIAPGDNPKQNLQDLTNVGLKQLAKKTKKVIRDNQFTVRRSNY